MFSLPELMASVDTDLPILGVCTPCLLYGSLRAATLCNVLAPRRPILYSPSMTQLPPFEVPTLLMNKKRRWCSRFHPQRKRKRNKVLYIYT